MTPDIVNFFFERQWNRVFTESSLEYYFTGEAGKRRMRLAELRPASRLAQLKPERLVQPKIRKAFPDTAFWNADIVTDNAGRAHAKVDFSRIRSLPGAPPPAWHNFQYTGGQRDSQDHRAQESYPPAGGSALLRTQGDEVVISALAHNYLSGEKDRARIARIERPRCHRRRH